MEEYYNSSIQQSLSELSDSLEVNNTSLTENFDDIDSKDFFTKYQSQKDLLPKKIEKLSSLAQNLSFHEDYCPVEEINAEGESLTKATDEKDKFFQALEALRLKRQADERTNKQLSEKLQSLEKKLASLTLEERKKRELYEQKEAACDKAISMYSSLFDFTVKIENQSDSSYEAYVRFNFIEEDTPLKLKIDKKLGEIISADTSALFTEDMEKILEQEVGDMKNMPKLLARIRLLLLKSS